MKKIILILAVFFGLAQLSQAQMFSFGVKGGLGLSKLSIEDLSGLNSGGAVYDLATGESVAAYHVGVQTRVKIAMLFVQPELYFNDGGGSVEKIVDGGVDQVMNVDFKRMDLPVLVGVKFGPLRVGAGPVGSYVMSESITNVITDMTDYTFFNKSLTWGFQAGLGVDLSKITLDVRYEGSLSKLGETLTVGGADFQLDGRPSQWIFSLGFMF